MSLSYLKRRHLPALTLWSTKERRGEYGPFTREPAERFAARSEPPISSACTSTNHPTPNTSRHEHLENEGRHGKKDDWVSTPTPNGQKNMSKRASIPTLQENEPTRKSESDSWSICPWHEECFRHMGANRWVFFESANAVFVPFLAVWDVDSGSVAFL